MATILDGRPVAQQLQTVLRQQIAKLVTPPSLTILLVGQNPASLSYIKRKQKLAEALDIALHLEQLSLETTTEQLIDRVNYHNRALTNGIIVQLPLPEHINTPAVLEAVDQHKDVDGLTPSNLGKLLSGYPDIAPATARGVVAMLDYYHIPLAGQQVVVVGRSRLVGRPLAQLLLDLNATVTVVHRQTRDVPAVTRTADILVVAAGHPGLIQPDMVKPGAVVVDVGLTKTDQGIQGDVNPAVAEVASALSPVPGGVGPLTVTCLMQNVVQAAMIQADHD